MMRLWILNWPLLLYALMTGYWLTSTLVFRQQVFTKGFFGSTALEFFAVIGMTLATFYIPSYYCIVFLSKLVTRNLWIQIGSATLISALLCWKALDLPTKNVLEKMNDVYADIERSILPSQE